MDDKHKVFLLNLARTAIKSKFSGEKLDFSNIPNVLKDIKCCFVTLTINDDLRGCIGHLEAFEPLYLNVVNNAINAAFHDTRFPPLSFDELRNVKIEISVLSSPEKLIYLNSDDLLSKLSSDLGVILKKDDHQSTFLPQVWSVFPDKVDFLENLCTKAGLLKDDWKNYPDIFIYKVEKFSE